MADNNSDKKSEQIQLVEVPAENNGGSKLFAILLIVTGILVAGAGYIVYRYFNLPGSFSNEIAKVEITDDSAQEAVEIPTGIMDTDIQPQSGDSFGIVQGETTPVQPQTSEYDG